MSSRTPYTSMSKNHILLVTNLFPNPLEPERGIFIAQIVERLKHSCKITVISPLPWFPKAKFFCRLRKWYKFALIPKEGQVHGVKVFYPKYLVIPKMFGFLHSVFLFLSVYTRVKKIHQQEEIDLINAHWIYPDGVAATWIARRLGLPVILSAHGCDVNFLPSYKLRRFQIIQALKFCQKVTVVNHIMGKRVEKLGVPTRKIHVIPNGVNFDLFYIRNRQLCREKLNLEPDKKIILFVGQLVGVKGVTYLIKAVKLLRKEWGGVRFKVMLIGEGPLRQSLEEEIAALGIGGEVQLLGLQPYEMIPLWMGACDLLCLPSIREGTPCVILEVLACGRPVVASKVGGIPEFVQQENGILFSARNFHELACCLKEALNRRWDEETIRKTVCHMSWEKAAQRYWQEMKSLLPDDPAIKIRSIPKVGVFNSE